MTGPAKRNLRIALLLTVFGTMLPPAVHAAQKAKTVECTVLLDRETGQTLLRKGTCDQRLTPMSTFKVPLALMGYDAGILVDEHIPTWDYKPEFNAPKRARKPVDPTIWQEESILWFSQQLTRKLGREKFADYVARFQYGNSDVRGVKGGEDGLTHAWLMSSLAISPDEEADFVRRLVNRQLPVSDKAFDMAEKIVPAFAAGDGWTVHGKTGSGWLRDAKGAIDKTRPLGWFVGWAEKGSRHIVFARMRIGTKRAGEAPGLLLRDVFLRELPGLMAKQ
jgi:beta-lactamase class D